MSSKLIRSRNYHISSICTAFGEKTIGTKVRDKIVFFDELSRAIDDIEKAQRWPSSGQAVLRLSPAAIEAVSCGVAKVEDVGEHHVVPRFYRGRWIACAPRHFAAKAESVHVVVYKRDAYMHDPDVQAEEELVPYDCTHVIVAVLAAVGPESPMPPWTLVHNIAGGNRQYLRKLFNDADAADTEKYVRDPEANHEWIAHDLTLLHKIVSEARASDIYWHFWMIVAD